MKWKFEVCPNRSRALVNKSHTLAPQTQSGNSLTESPRPLRSLGSRERQALNPDVGLGHRDLVN